MTIEFLPRPSMRLIQQIAQLERFSGAWERLSRSDALASSSLHRETLRSGSGAALALDITSPAGSTQGFPGNGTRWGGLVVEKSKLVNGNEAAIDETDFSKEHYAVDALMRAHQAEVSLDLAGIEYLYELITSDPQQPAPREIPAEGDLADPSKHRRTAAHFLSKSDSVIFPTVSSFLIAQRLEELVQWCSEELDEERLHPLLIIGTFHLLFLQISPYAVGNHRLATLITWRLLADNGYSYVRHCHFTPIWAKNSTLYFNALRQAEKSARGNWSTLNIWLEFFLDSLLEASRALTELSDQRTKDFSLSGVQRQIIDVVKNYGAVTRDTIVKETGINMSTIKYNLGILSGQGQLKRAGAGRTTNYSLI